MNKKTTAAKTAPASTNTGRSLAAKLEQFRANKTDLQTFNINDAEMAEASNGNIIFQVETDQGNVITFWLSLVDDLIEELDDDGNCRLLPGVTMSEDGALLPAQSKKQWFK